MQLQGPSLELSSLSLLRRGAGRSGFAFEKSLKARVGVDGWRVVLHQATCIRSRAIIAVLLTAKHAKEAQLLARWWAVCVIRRESRPGEFHPEALAEPDVTLSRHPAPIKEPLRNNVQGANSSGLRRETASTQSRARRT